MVLQTHYRALTINKKIFAKVLFIAGVYFLSSSVYMQAKAELAQWLIASSWQQPAHDNKMPKKPWPWADTRAIASLEIPRLESKLYVMQDASGESLAFGPGHVLPSDLPAHNGHVVIAGHRDSHFSVLQEVKIGDLIKTTHYNQQQKSYRINKIRVINSDKQEIDLTDNQNKLTLITCYPFNTITTNGPLRLLIDAQAI